MPGMYKKSGSYLLVLLMVLSLWTFLYLLVKARYEHFSDCGTVENYSSISISDTSALDPTQSDMAHFKATQNPLLKDEKSQLGFAGFFWSEAAFHYRTTLMYAVDWFQDPGVLHRDRWQEYPEGVDAWSQYSILMEPVLGTLYRLFFSSSQNLIHFLMVILPLFHALLLFPIYYLARLVSGSCRWALASMAVFATCSLTFSPLISSLYVKETFSWILFAAFLMGHFTFLQNRKIGWLILGAGGLYLFLISWHLASFLTIPVMLVGALVETIHEKERLIENKSIQKDPKDRKGQKDRFFLSSNLLQPLAYLIVFIIASFVPWLGERGFVFSIPTLCVVLWVVSAGLWEFRFFKESKKHRVLTFLAASVVVLGIGFLNARFWDDYAHVSGLVWSQVVNGLQKPIDPAGLPFDMRVFWVSPFISPSWLVLKSGLGFNGILLVMATCWMVIKSFRDGLSDFEKSVIWCAASFLAVFLLVERLAPVFILFGAVVLSLFGLRLEKQLKGKAISSFVLPAFLLIPLLNPFFSMGGMIQVAMAGLQGNSVGSLGLDKEWDLARSQMFEWITENTAGPGLSQQGNSASFVGEIGVSTQLLLYTGRPIVLNSQFENQKIRLKYSEYLAALYSEKEEDLVRFFRKYKVNYVFLNRDWATSNGRNSPKYLAGKTGQSFLNFNVSRLHFDPLSLEHFQPVYENSCYRVFAFAAEGQKQPVDPWEATYNRWWNLKNFSSAKGKLLDSSTDRAAIRELDFLFQKLPYELQKLSDSIDMKWRKQNSPASSRETLLNLQRKLGQARFQLLIEGENEYLLGRIRELEETTNARLQEVHPVSGQTLQNELLRFLNGQPGEQDGLLKPMASQECSPEEYHFVGQILVILGKFELAGEFFGKGGALFPKPALTREKEGLRPTEVQELLWQETVRYLMAGGEALKARRLARFCATHVSPDSPRLEFFIQAGHIEKVN